MEKQCELNAAHESIQLAGTKFDIEGLHCANCAMKIEAKLNQTPGIEEAVLNFTTKKIIAKSDLEPTELLKVVRGVVDSIEDGVTVTYLQQPKKQALISFKSNWNLILGVPVYLAGLGLHLEPLVLLAYAIIGFGVIKTAVKNVANRDFFEENFLMSVATLGAIAIGEYNRTFYTCTTI